MISVPELPKPMTKEEKAQLLENWNEDSWKVLAERNLRLVVQIVNSFQNTGIEEEELFGIAQLGLVKAARKFKPEFGNEFTTYAVPVIRSQILIQIRTNKSRPYPTNSINEPFVIGHDGQTCELGDLIACTKDPFEEVEERQFFEYIRNLLDKEDKKYREIILLSFDGLKQREIADKIGISQSYVSRILKKYKDKCHDYIESG